MNENKKGASQRSTICSLASRIEADRAELPRHCISIDRGSVIVCAPAMSYGPPRLKLIFSVGDTLPSPLGAQSFSPSRRRTLPSSPNQSMSPERRTSSCTYLRSVSQPGRTNLDGSRRRLLSLNQYGRSPRKRSRRSSRSCAVMRISPRLQRYNLSSVGIDVSTGEPASPSPNS